MTFSEPLEKRSLFGGAMEMSMPARFVDVSDFRPVPDNQEVWADGASDQSVIVEIVEHSSEVSNSEAAAFFFRDLASANDAAESELQACSTLMPQDVPGLPASATKVLARGYLVAAKGRQGREAANRVLVLVAVVRLPDCGADLLVTLNTAADISVASAAAEHAGAGSRSAEPAGAQALLAAMLRTLAIRDYGLFGS